MSESETVSGNRCQSKQLKLLLTGYLYFFKTTKYQDFAMLLILWLGFWVIVGLLSLISIGCCCYLCCCGKKNKKKRRRDLDTEFGDITLFENGNRENKSVLAEEHGPSEKGNIKITKPHAVRGKLYNQDYKEITEKVFRTGILFKDKKVDFFHIFNRTTKSF